MRERIRSNRWTLLLAAILAVSVAYNLVESDGYLSTNNFLNLFELSIEKIIVVVVMTLVIVAGEIDLSVASLMVLSASVIGALHEGGAVPFGLAVLIALAAAVAVSGLGLPGEMRDFTLNGCAPEFALWSFVDLGYLAYYVAYGVATGQLDPTEGASFTAGRMGTYTIEADPTRDNGLRVVMGPFTVYNADNV